MSIFLKRDTKVYIETSSSASDSVMWEIPVMDGFSFSQGNTSSEVTLNEMADASGNSNRGRRVFNDALAPAEWSFSTYIRPFKASGSGTADDTIGVHHAIEEYLWALFVGSGEVGGSGTYDYTLTNITADTTDSNISMAGSNLAELGTCQIYFVMGANNAANANYTAGSSLEIYKISGAVVNEAVINFSVDGIAMIDWSGFGSQIQTIASLDATGAITEDIAATDNYIRNKLTAMSITAADTTTFPGASSNGVYNITLTGGSITLSNNITFLTPETLGSVNTPIGHITGNKSVSGNFTAYVSSGTAGDSGSLFDALTSTAGLGKVTNSFATTFKIGGASGTPRFELALPTAHFKVPTIQSDDVISIDVGIEGIPSTITSNDEFTITYVGAA